MKPRTKDNLIVYGVIGGMWLVILYVIAFELLKFVALIKWLQS